MLTEDTAACLPGAQHGALVLSFLICRQDPPPPLPHQPFSTRLPFGIGQRAFKNIDAVTSPPESMIQFVWGGL